MPLVIDGSEASYVSIRRVACEILTLCWLNASRGSHLFQTEKGILETRSLRQSPLNRLHIAVFPLYQHEPSAQPLGDNACSPRTGEGV